MMTHRTTRTLPIGLALLALLAGLAAAPRTALAQDPLTWTWQRGETFYYQWTLEDQGRYSDLAGTSGMLNTSHYLAMVLKYEVLSVSRGTARLKMTFQSFYLDATTATGERYRYDSRTLADLGSYFDDRVRPFPQLLGKSVVLQVDSRGNVLQTEDGGEDLLATHMQQLMPAFDSSLATPLTLGSDGLRQAGTAHRWVMPGYPDGRVTEGSEWERDAQWYVANGRFDGRVRVTFDGTQRFRGLQVARMGISAPETPAFTLHDDTVESMEVQRAQLGGTAMHGTALGMLVNSRLEMQVIARAELKRRSPEEEPRQMSVRINRTIHVELLQGTEIEQAIGFDESNADPQTVFSGVSAFRSGVMLQRDRSLVLLTHVAQACTRYLEIFGRRYGATVGDRYPSPPTEESDAQNGRTAREQYVAHVALFDTLADAARYLAALGEASDETEFLVWLIDHLQRASELEGVPTRLRAVLRAGKVNTQVRLAQLSWLREKVEAYRAAIATAQAALAMPQIDEATFRRLHELNVYAHLQLRDHEGLNRYLTTASEAARGASRLFLLQLHLDALQRSYQWEQVPAVADEILFIAHQVPNLPATVAALTAKARAQATTGDARLRETLAALGELGRLGRQAVAEVERFRGLLPLRQARNFHLPLVGGDGATMQLRDFEGRHTAILFFRSNDRLSVQALRRFQDVAGRYDESLLSVIAIGAGRDAGESDEALQEARARWSAGHRPSMTWLWDRSGSVTRAYGVEGHPTIYLVGPAGRVLWAERVMPNFQQLPRLRDALERNLELAEDAPFLIQEEIGIEDSPEYQLLRELMEFVRLRETHLAWLGRSVQRVGDLLGSDGRLLVRSLLMLLLIDPDAGVEREVVQNLLRTLDDK